MDPRLCNKDAHSMMLLSGCLRGEINPFIFGPELVNFGAVFIRDTRAKEPSKVVSLDTELEFFLVS